MSEIDPKHARRFDDPEFSTKVSIPICLVP
jgi:hypothetical protein